MKFESVATISDSNVEDLVEVEMGFSSDAIPHLTQMFVNLYNNPEEAVYREILFNAIDATNKVGNPKNIEVWLPTYDTPVLTITDFGCGMGYEELTKAVQFGGTDKNGDNNSVGGFGLGMKSPLAITSQFSVETVKDGHRTVATISNSEDGICRLVPLIREETDLPDGTTVSIPVKDSYVFRRIASRYSAFVPEIITYYNTQEYPYFTQKEHYKSSEKVTENLYLFPGEYGGLTVVMGGVPYKVPFEDIYQHIPKFKGLFHSNKGFLLEVPIGSLRLSPNREGIQFNQQTKDSLYKIISEEIIGGIEEAEKLIEGCKTFNEAYKTFYNTILKHFTNPSNTSWEGINLSDRRIRLGHVPEDYTDAYGNERTRFIQDVFKVIYENSVSKIEDHLSIDDKITLVEPHPDVSPNRATYTIRRYFKKNEKSFNSIVAYLSKSFDEYLGAVYQISSDKLVYPDPDNEELSTLKSLYDLYGQEYEVISILDMKKDIEGWKPEGETPKTPKVKYLDKVVRVLVKSEDGRLSYDSKTISDVMGDGEKTLGIYEYKKGKDDSLSIRGVRMDSVNEWVESEYGEGELEEIVILDNNSKVSVFEKNTNKFGNTYRVIPDFSTVVDYGSVAEIAKILDKDISIWVWEKRGSGVFLLNHTDNIKDPSLKALLSCGTGTESLTQEEYNTLKSTSLSMGESLRDLFSEYMKKLGFSDSEVEEMVTEYKYNSYTSIYSLIGRAIYGRISNYVHENYPLTNPNSEEESVRYINLVFDDNRAS